MNLIILAALAAFSVDLAFSQRWSGRSWPPKPQGALEETCLSGDGSSYRGYVSMSVKGKRCLNWLKFDNYWGASKGIGNHNYCRNPDWSLKPWCRVRRGRRIVREFCNIPRCSAPSVEPPTPTLAHPPAVDTELTCGEKSEQKMHKIVGGSFTPIESQPWVAAIFSKGSKFVCGGTLISPCWVVSAAHCFTDGTDSDIDSLSVYLGKRAINDTDADKEQSFTVEKLIVHQEFNDENNNNDIALLKIKSRNGGCAVKTATARTVCLPPPYTQLPAGFRCTVAGFGQTSYMGAFSQHLKQTQVNLISRSDCSRELYYGDKISENMLCAASPDWSTDACHGDSGGPLVCELSGRVFLFGVVSWGEGCAKVNKPGVYTQVTNYNKWIAAKTGLTKYTTGSMYPQK